MSVATGNRFDSGITPSSGGSLDTFCIHPWTRLRVEPAGAAICCAFRSNKIAAGGKPLLPTEHSLEEIWNSQEMRDTRRAMTEGRQVAGCEECYQNEASGGGSMRTRDNATWDAGWLNEDHISIDALKQVAIANDFKLPFAPVSMEVDTGSLCNLMCRMCHGAVSSRIATDSVHSVWALDGFAGGDYHNETLTPRTVPVSRFPKQSFINDVSTYADNLKRLYLIGGEPTLVKEIRGILEKLIRSGHAPRIELALVSNGSVTESWLDLAKHFKKLQLAISVDGFEQHYEYIRYPYRWDRLVQNIAAFQAMPQVSVGAAVTIQANNMLHITKLFRYFDAIGVGFYSYLVHRPRHLSIWAMPRSVRQIASDRLRQYGETDCQPDHRAMISGLCNQIAPCDATCDPKLVRQFMLFTNDLDLSRGQSIHDTDPELVSLLAQDGFDWTHDTLHAGQAFPPRRRTAPLTVANEAAMTG